MQNKKDVGALRVAAIRPDRKVVLVLDVEVVVLQLFERRHGTPRGFEQLDLDRERVDVDAQLGDDAVQHGQIDPGVPFGFADCGFSGNFGNRHTISPDVRDRRKMAKCYTTRR